MVVAPVTRFSSFQWCMEQDIYLRRYTDQNETTAKTCIFRNLMDGRPRTWSGTVSVCYNSTAIGYDEPIMIDIIGEQVRMRKVCLLR